MKTMSHDHNELIPLLLFVWGDGACLCMRFYRFLWSDMSVGFIYQCTMRLLCERYLPNGGDNVNNASSLSELICDFFTCLHDKVRVRENVTVSKTFFSRQQKQCV